MYIGVLAARYTLPYVRCVVLCCVALRALRACGSYTHVRAGVQACVCVCVCARACACVRACAGVCGCVHVCVRALGVLGVLSVLSANFELWRCLWRVFLFLS